MISVEVGIYGLETELDSFDKIDAFTQAVESAVRSVHGVSKEETVSVTISDIPICNLQRFVQAKIYAYTYDNVETRCMRGRVRVVIKEVLSSDNSIPAICSLAA